MILMKKTSKPDLKKKKRECCYKRFSFYFKPIAILNCFIFSSSAASAAFALASIKSLLEFVDDEKLEDDVAFFLGGPDGPSVPDFLLFVSMAILSCNESISCCSFFDVCIPHANFVLGCDLKTSEEGDVMAVGNWFVFHNCTNSSKNWRALTVWRSSKSICFNCFSQYRKFGPLRK